MNSDKHFDGLKALRSQWMTVEALVFEMGAAISNVRRFLRCGVEQGLIVSRQAKKPEGRSGYAPAEYTISKAWGGQG